MTRGRVPLAYLTAYMQIAVGVMFMLIYAGLLYALFLGTPTIPENVLELAKTLAIGMTNALGLLFAFLYLRSRTDGTPNPDTTTTQVIQTTGPTGTPPPAVPAVPIGTAPASGE